MKKLVLLSLTLAIVSLACLETAAIAVPTASPTSAAFVKVDVHPAGAVFEPVIITSTPALQICARVIAIQSLHVRAGASENDIVLAWLKNGEVVNVIDQANDEWWRIEHEEIVGYARSIYLQEGAC